jgi:hypothetical protein
MKFRQSTPLPDEAAEGELTSSVRRLAAQRGGGDLERPPGAYWQNLLVRTNAGIDDASSGKAITLSWAARVAIPGVVAILSFLVGLRYFVPDHPGIEPSLTSVVLTLPQGVLDSIQTERSAMDRLVDIAEAGVDVFELSRDDVSRYYLEEGQLPDAAASLNDQQVTEVLALLTSTGSEPITGGPR